jgi:hypothetical protein
MPTCVEAELGLALVEQAEDDALAVDGRDDDRRMSTFFDPMRTVVCPSCGLCRLAMSSSVMTLRRELIAGARLSGG